MSKHASSSGYGFVFLLFLRLPCDWQNDQSNLCARLWINKKEGGGGGGLQRTAKIMRKKKINLKFFKGSRLRRVKYKKYINIQTLHWLEVGNKSRTRQTARTDRCVWVNSRGAVVLTFSSSQPSDQIRQTRETDSQIDTWHWADDARVTCHWQGADCFRIGVSTPSCLLPQWVSAGAWKSPESSGEYLCKSDGAERHTHRHYIHIHRNMHSTNAVWEDEVQTHAQRWTHTQTHTLIDHRQGITHGQLGRYFK